MMLFRDIDFGPDDAKGDTRLSEYFVRIPEYEKVRTGAAWLVVGRKGTGKTAICEMIHDECTNSPEAFSVVLSFKNAPTSDLFASSDRTFRAPNEYVSIWRFLITLESCKLLLQDESVDSAARDELEAFLRLNFGQVDVACLDAVSMLRERSWKVGFTPPVEGAPGAELTHNTGTATHQQIHYGRAAATLLQRLSELRSENRFYLLFDELDEDYRKEPAYFHLLISLLKACYGVRQELRGRISILPIVVLREDIYSQLDDGDLNKLDDVTVRLKWSSSRTDDRQLSLRRMVNERIRSDRDSVQSDAWLDVVQESDWRSADGGWAYVTALTMDRPRDIVKLLKCCQEYEPGQTLTKSGINQAVAGYSAWLYREIANEIFRELPEYRLALGVVGRVANRAFGLETWLREFTKEEELASKYRPDQVLETLFDFSVVGIAARGRNLFKYKTDQLIFDKGASFCVHPGLKRHLAIHPST